MEEVAATLGARAEPFDAVVLGLGSDGHTASWFPHAQGLGQALSEKAGPVAAIRAAPSDVTGAHLDRLTLTLTALKNARLILMLISGQEKRAAFEAACGPGPVEDMPARAILKARPDMWVCWWP